MCPFLSPFCLFVFPRSIGSSLIAKYASVSVGEIHGCVALNMKQLLYSQTNSHPACINGWKHELLVISENQEVLPLFFEEMMTSTACC